MKYHVVKRWNQLNDFLTEVNDLLAEGFTLVGGVAVTHDSDGNICYCQALTKQDSGK